MAGKLGRRSFYSHRVQVRIEGFRLDRFTDRCMKAGIRLRNLQVKNDTEMVCTVAGADLKQLQCLAKSTYRVTTMDERGVFPMVREFLKQPFLVVGCLLAAGIIGVQAFLIETVEVEGYRAIPEQVLLSCLEEAGICEGGWIPGIDWETAEQTIYERFPQVTWAQLVYSGRLVRLNISETDHLILGVDVPSDYAEGSGRCEPVCTHIVAAESGYIEEILPYYGMAMAEAGDYVEKGQILISGRVPLEPTTFEPEDALEKEYFVQAEGKVLAKVPYYLTFNQERYLWNQPRLPEDSATLDRREKSDEEVQTRTEQQIRIWAEENLPEKAEILKKSLKFSRNGNIIEVSVLLEVRQEIGTHQEEFIGTKDTDTRDN